MSWDDPRQDNMHADRWMTQHLSHGLEHSACTIDVGIIETLSAYCVHAVQFQMPAIYVRTRSYQELASNSYSFQKLQQCIIHNFWGTFLRLHTYVLPYSPAQSLNVGLLPERTSVPRFLTPR